MGIKKQFLLLMITIMPVAYVSGIVIFDIAAECISENSDLKKDQVQSEEENNPQFDLSIKNEKSQRNRRFTAVSMGFIWNFASYCVIIIFQ